MEHLRFMGLSKAVLQAYDSTIHLCMILHLISNLSHQFSHIFDFQPLLWNVYNCSHCIVKGITKRLQSILLSSLKKQNWLSFFQVDAASC